MARFPLFPRFSAALTLALLAAPAVSQQLPAAESPAATPALPFAFFADLTSGAPVIADVTVRSAQRIKGPEAAGVAPGLTRYYITADVGALVRGSGGVPPRIGYLVDLGPAADGRAPRLKKARLLLFARKVDGTADQVQLVSPDGQIAWSVPADALTRRIARELVAADAPPRVTGIGHAFHVAGSLPGEGESQVFLQTADNRPVSLSVIRRPGEPPRWAVALSEIVDEAAGPPAPATLLWYRLACFLPRTLPAESTAGLADADATAAAQDYRFVLDALGPCGMRARLAAASAGGAPA